LPQQGTPVEAISTNKQETLGEGGTAGRKNFATKPKRGKKKKKGNRIERRYNT
jgi:hypothetical protein